MSSFARELAVSAVQLILGSGIMYASVRQFNRIADVGLPIPTFGFGFLVDTLLFSLGSLVFWAIFAFVLAAVIVAYERWRWSHLRELDVDPEDLFPQEGSE